MSGAENDEARAFIQALFGTPAETPEPDTPPAEAPPAEEPEHVQLARKAIEAAEQAAPAPPTELQLLAAKAERDRRLVELIHPPSKEGDQ